MINLNVTNYFHNNFTFFGRVYKQKLSTPHFSPNNHILPWPQNHYKW